MSSIINGNFLEVFPPEITNKIYEYVLQSPTGRVELSTPRYGLVEGAPVRFKIFPAHSGPTGRQEIRLSFLRTCKKIHTDCKNMFWPHNILNVTSLTSDGCFGLLPNAIKKKVVAVEMDIDEYQVDLYSLQEKLEEIQLWVEEGSLKSFAARGIYMASTKTNLAEYLAWVTVANMMDDEQL
ncbi:hypothetical protein DL98DRAFT_589365 [Cadophora sp. DSE1049]|nr:hypothetical protein DL98DRAFT_589365 [Cadophora sp. DSE1049]